MNDLLTYEEVAEMLGLKTRTVALWVRQGKIPAFKFGRKANRIARADLDTYIENHRIKAA